MSILSVILAAQATFAKKLCSEGCTDLQEECRYFYPNGYSEPFDYENATDEEREKEPICVSPDPILAGDQCSEPLTFSSHEPINYIGVCETGTYCYFAHDYSTDSPDAVAICLSPVECGPDVGQHSCMELTDSSNLTTMDPMDSHCTMFDEAGHWTIIDSKAPTSTPPNELRESDQGFCIPRVTAYTGEPCGVPGNDDIIYNRFCELGHACRVDSNNVPICRENTELTECYIADGEEDMCVAGTCTIYNDDGTFSTPNVVESGFCLEPVSFGQACTTPILSEDDLTMYGVLKNSCMDTYACVIPDVFDQQMPPILCTVADAVQVTCNASSPCDESIGVCTTIDETGLTVEAEDGVCLLKTEIGMACTDVITDETQLADHLVRSCPEGVVCGIGTLFETTGQAECLGLTTTSSPGGSTTTAGTEGVIGGCESGDDCDLGEYCTGSDGLLVDGGSGECLQGAQPGELCADSSGTPVAFCLSTEGCQPSGIWSKCAGEYQDGAYSVFASAATALIATMLLF